MRCTSTSEDPPQWAAQGRKGHDVSENGPRTLRGSRVTWPPARIHSRSIGPYRRRGGKRGCGGSHSSCLRAYLITTTLLSAARPLLARQAYKLESSDSSLLRSSLVYVLKTKILGAFLTIDTLAARMAASRASLDMAKHFSYRQVTSAPSRCLPAPLGTPWGATKTLRREFMLGTRAPVRVCLFSTSSARQRVQHIPVRGIRTVSTKAGNNSDPNRTRLGAILAVSVSVALGVSVYLRQQSSIRMDASTAKNSVIMTPPLRSIRSRNNDL